MDGWMDGWSDGPMSEHLDKWSKYWMDEVSDGPMSEHVDEVNDSIGWMDGVMDQ